MGTASARLHLLVGGAALLAAAASVVLQSPSPPAVSAPASSGTSRSARREIASLGPLRVGDVIGDRWKVDGITAEVAEVQVVVSRDGATFTLGLSSPAGRSERGLVPMSDLYVSYTGQDGSAALAAVIRALTDRLREGADGQPLHARVLGWAAEAPAAAP